MKYKRYTKEEAIQKIQDILNRNGYISVHNIRREGLYYVVRKYWGGIEKMKKEIGLKSKGKPRVIDWDQHIKNIKKAYIKSKRSNFRYMYRYLGYTYHFLMYNRQRMKIIEKIEKMNISNKEAIIRLVKSIIYKTTLKRALNLKLNIMIAQAMPYVCMRYKDYGKKERELIKEIMYDDGYDHQIYFKRRIKRIKNKKLNYWQQYRRYVLFQNPHDDIKVLKNINPFNIIKPYDIVYGRLPA